MLKQFFSRILSGEKIVPTGVSAYRVIMKKENKDVMEDVSCKTLAIQKAGQFVKIDR